ELAAAATHARILAAAKALFTRSGIDAVTIADLAKRAQVADSTVYALFQSKEGVLRALIERSLFGERYREAARRLENVDDPVDQIAMTATVARAIYENEAAELGLLRGTSAFSPALRKMEQSLEATRYALQKARVGKLFAARKAKRGLTIERARRLLWMYTS